MIHSKYRNEVEEAYQVGWRKAKEEDGVSPIRFRNSIAEEIYERDKEKNGLAQELTEIIEERYAEDMKAYQESSDSGPSRRPEDIILYVSKTNPCIFF